MTADDQVVALLDAVRVERAALREKEALHARECAPGFNMIKVFEPGETGLSKAFRWLLDDQGSHGQDSVFRELFFDQLVGGEECNVDWSGASVTCEVPTADGLGRIDILIVSRDRNHCVAIENKPWASWQSDQMRRYLNDQRAIRSGVRVHALIGGVLDADVELLRHWHRGQPSNLADELPMAVTANHFSVVIDWLEACVEAARPERVKAFLLDLAQYCRSHVQMEITMTDPGRTAATILAGGADHVRAAREIEAALPYLVSGMTEAVAARIGGRTDKVGKYNVVRIEIEGVPLAFALFGLNGQWPWAGITDERWRSALKDSIKWEVPDSVWPRWAFLANVDRAQGSLMDGIRDFDLDQIAQALPEVARQLLER